MLAWERSHCDGLQWDERMEIKCCALEKKKEGKKTQHVRSYGPFRKMRKLHLKTLQWGTEPGLHAGSPTPGVLPWGVPGCWVPAVALRGMAPLPPHP